MEDSQPVVAVCPDGCTTGPILDAQKGTYKAKHNSRFSGSYQGVVRACDFPTSFGKSRIDRRFVLAWSRMNNDGRRSEYGGFWVERKMEGNMSRLIMRPVVLHFTPEQYQEWMKPGKRTKSKKTYKETEDQIKSYEKAAGRKPVRIRRKRRPIRNEFWLLIYDMLPRWIKACIQVVCGFVSLCVGLVVLFIYVLAIQGFLGWN